MEVSEITKQEVKKITDGINSQISQWQREKLNYQNEILRLDGLIQNAEFRRNALAVDIPEPTSTFVTEKIGE